MSALLARCAGYLNSAAMLMRSEVRIPSIALYPIRRRLTSHCSLTLRNGITLVAPCGEPLLTLFRDVWVQRHYSLPGYSFAAGDVIVDIGAHVGTFTVWAASAHSGVRVIAVEPFPPSVEYLRQNVEANHLSNVTIVEACCGALEGTVELHGRGMAACNTIYQTDNYRSTFRSVARPKMITLDRLFSDLGIERCDLLKLDCEGAEYEILCSASKITLDRVQRIAMEYHQGMNQHTPQALAAQLERSGFSVDLQPPQDQEGGYLLATRG